MAFCIQDRHGISMSAAAQRWLQHHSVLGPEDSVIIGVSKIEQLEGNVKDWCVTILVILAAMELIDCFVISEGGPLPEEVMKILDAAANKAVGLAPYYAQLQRR